MRNLSKSHGPRVLRRLLAVTIAVAASALTIVPAPSAATTTSQRVDPAIEWYDITISTLNSSDAPQGMENMRAWAIAWLASARAVNTTPPAGPPRDYQEAALAAAVHESLVSLVPAHRAELDDALATTLGRIPDGDAETQGVAAGRAAARDVLADREGDGLDNESANEPYTPPPPGPGVWQPTPPDYTPGVLGGLAKARPFALAAADQFRPGPPPALGSGRYRAEWTEVRDYGASDSTVRTAEQTEIATFWRGDDSVFYPAIRAALRELAGSPVQQAEMVAVFRIAAVDTTIAVYDAKYHYVWWRPITAIRDADIDGDPATAPDPDWTPLHTTPPHPDYLSGHAGFAGATEGSLTAFTGRGPGTRFALTSGTLPGVTRTYTQWSQLTAEMVDARVWSGIHTRTADTAAATVGRQVSAYIVQESDRLFG